MFRGCVYPGFFREFAMETAIDRVMQTYGMIVSLTADEEKAAREKLPAILLKSLKLTNTPLLLRACGIFEA